MKRQFRQFARLQWIVIMALAVTACTPAAPSAPTQPAQSKPAAAAATSATSPAAAPAQGQTAAQRSWPLPSGDVTINLWDSAEQTKAALYNETLIPEYKKLHPNVTINYESISTADMLQKLLVALSAGTGPELFC